MPVQPADPPAAFLIDCEAHPARRVGFVCYADGVIFLIDGYNLLHAIGLASRNLPAKEFAREFAAQTQPKEQVVHALEQI